MLSDARTKATARPAAETPLTVSVRGADAEARRAYRAACRGALFSPTQSPDWIDAWAPAVPNEALLACVFAGERMLLGVALEIVDDGRLRLARFAGDRHANGNFPATAADVPDERAGPLAAALIDGICRARPDIDLLALERQVDTFGGHANPLLSLPHGTSPNVALAVDLDGGFDALMARSSGKRKRKQHRSRARKYEAAGGFCRRQATSPADVEAMLAAFFAMKKVRFAKMGITDTFAPAHVQQAFGRLFASALEATPPAFVLHGLEIGGRLRAVTGSSRTADRLICEFSAIAEDELTEASPGAFLFHENIREACDEGLAVYDFSVGDEHYKRLWCDLETDQFDVFAPLTAKGRLAALLRSRIAAAKRTVNRNPRLWAAAKWLRRRIGGSRG